MAHSKRMRKRIVLQRHHTEKMRFIRINNFFPSKMSLQNFHLDRDNESTEEYWPNPNNLHLLCLVQSPVQAPRFIIMLSSTPWLHLSRSFLIPLMEEPKFRVSRST